MAAIFFCWGREQWFSMESMRGKGEATNALLSMTLTTSRKEILVVSVWPWKMTGRPSSPSQQSSSTHRQPETEFVFIYVLAHWKKLIRNCFYCELIQKPVFLPFYKCFSQRVTVFRGFFPKDRFFLKKIGSFKESDRTFSFDIFTLFVLSFFDIKFTFFLSMTRTLSYLFLLRFCIMFHVSIFNSGFIVYILNIPSPPPPPKCLPVLL